ncbi:hypothetical protein [Sphingorhabdus sp. Alg231-15]|uniref:hypothetical protein n=1 Tax=Sphingorhabdus sp. Alg231-15 TaxID=1922222 RepID=UPI000D550EEA
MTKNSTLTAIAAATCFVSTPAMAQEAADTNEGTEAAAIEIVVDDSVPGDEILDVSPMPEPPAPTYKLAADGSVCELHVWPTENYIGINTGLLSGFGIVGALADQAAHKNRVATVKDLMKDYLGPEVQMEELNKLGINETLKLDGYKIIVQEPTPFNEDAKEDPELKAKIKAMNKTIKAKKRLTDSTAPCYAELTTTHIFYHKAMMYGSNLFTGWIYREFDGDTQTKVGKGQVKNPLEYFPPKTEEDIEKAQIELRDAYAKDFAEYVEKKVFKKKRKKR